MKRKFLMMGSILAVATLSYASGVQAADAGGWYFGLGVGRSDAKKTGSWAEQADAALLANGITSTTTIGGGDTAWKLYAGYQFNENFAAEGGYTHLGKFGGTSVITAPAAATASGTWDADAVHLAAVGIAPIGKQFSAFGKLGLAYSRLRVNLAAPGAGVNPSNSRLQPALGLGLKYDFTKQFGLRAEWEHFNNVGDGSTTGQTAIEVFSLSGQLRF